MKTRLKRMIPHAFLFSLFVSCNEEEFFEKYPNAKDFVEFPKDAPPNIKPGVPFDPIDMDKCSEVLITGYDGSCLVFVDSFERTDLYNHEVFNWQLAIMDDGNMGGANVDAKIENSAHLGPVINGDKAVLFRGREGGSTHEVYLVSSPIDLSDFRQVYIQFRYLPMHLESLITLSATGDQVAESIRLDVCNSTDLACGLTGADPHTRMRDKNVWDRFWLDDPYEFGRNLNIRSYVLADWKLGQFIIDLADYPDRKDKFVFKISAAMDEGYDRNSRNRTMDDGIILDEVIVIALDGEFVSL
jgi:hypothetical protein